MIDGRFFAYTLLVLVLLLLYKAWQEDYGVQTAVAPLPSGESELIDDVPPAEFPAATRSQPELSATPVDESSSRQNRITVTTDVLSLEIDLRGGTISRVDLLKYPVAVDQPDQPVRLLT